MIVLINFLGYVYWKCRFKVGWFLLKRLGIDIFYEKPDPIKPGEFRVEAMDHTGKWNQFCYSGGSAGSRFQPSRRCAIYYGKCLHSSFPKAEIKITDYNGFVVASWNKTPVAAGNRHELVRHQIRGVGQGS